MPGTDTILAPGTHWYNANEKHKGIIISNSVINLQRKGLLSIKDVKLLVSWRHINIKNI